MQLTTVQGDSVKAFMNQSLYAKKFNEKMAILEGCAKDVQDQASLSHQQITANILKMAERQQEAIQEVNVKFGNLEIEIETLRPEMRELFFSFTNEISAQFDDMKTTFSGQFGDVRAQLEDLPT